MSLLPHLSAYGRYIIGLCLLPAWLIACSPNPATPNPTAIPTNPTPTIADPTSPTPIYAYTHLNPDGNRYVQGHGNFPSTQSRDIELSGTPAWVVGAPLDAGILWVAVLEDGQVEAFHVVSDSVEPYPITPDRLPAGVPPLLEVRGDTAQLLTAPTTNPTLNTPVVLDALEQIVAFTPQGAGLTILQGREPVQDPLPIIPLPDARLLTDGNRRILLYTEPTDRYDHAVLGDPYEAQSVTLVDTNGSARVVSKINVTSPSVFEGVAPIWADLNGDGQREVIVTQSNSSEGSRLVVYDESGTVVATGPAVGQGGRWRHQLMVAPFGLNGELELVDVLTPHIGGVVEFYRWQGDQLNVVAEVPGYTSHVFGTRNLDKVAAADFDGDEKVEVLVPTQDRRMLAAIRRTGNGAIVAWFLLVGGEVQTNVSVVARGETNLAVAVGRPDHILRIWQE